MKKRFFRFSNFAIIFMVFFFAYFSSTFTDTQSDWYKALQKPTIQPPSIVFSIVWPVLYMLIAYSIILVWNSRSDDKNVVLTHYSVNGLFNVTWSFYFFTAHSPFAAFITLIALWLSTYIIIIYDWNISKKSSYLLTPYLAWLTFAVILNMFFI